jgi:hypothetical protein
MPDLPSTLRQAAAAIFLLLGLVHGVMTLLDLRRPRFFAPRDRRLIPVLEQTRIGLTPRADFWRAWLGFNLSHSLGLALFGGGLIYLSRASGWEPARATVTAASIGVAAAYFTLALRFWFAVPAVGAGLGTLLLIVSWLLERPGGTE